MQVLFSRHKYYFGIIAQKTTPGVAAPGVETLIPIMFSQSSFGIINYAKAHPCGMRLKAPAFTGFPGAAWITAWRVVYGAHTHNYTNLWFVSYYPDLAARVGRSIMIKNSNLCRTKIVRFALSCNTAAKFFATFVLNYLEIRKQCTIFAPTIKQNDYENAPLPFGIWYGFPL